uniref:Inositol polyphosphate-4-phosphatase type II B n=1 Tax=Cyprinus carpio TaxID=7962 RepID=A0A8C1RCH2_CYPCA
CYLFYFILFYFILFYFILFYFILFLYTTSYLHLRLKTHRLGTRDPMFLTGVSFPPDWPVYSETLIKLSVYGVNDGYQQTVSKESNFLGSSSFSVADFLQSKDQQLSLSLRTADDSATVGTVVVSRMKMGEIEDGEVDHITADMHQKCTLVYESSHGRINDKDNGPIMNAVFKNAVCKVYRFQTVDSKGMLVREQMAECTLSFSIPKQLIALYIQEDTCRIQELKDLGELSPHWDNLRKDVISRYDQIIKEYQDTLAELEKLTGPLFKPSCSKGQKYLEFIPINLHTQRMRVTCPRKTDSFYDVVTVGAPAAHSHGFKNGGLQKLLSKYETEKKSTAYQCIYYPPEQAAKAREILCVVSQLQPHISALADQLLQTAQQSPIQPLRDILKSLEEKVRPADSCQSNLRQDFMVWASVAKSLNCVIALVDKLQEQDNNNLEPAPSHTLADVITSHNPVCRDQLGVKVQSLKECVAEVAERARCSVSFVLLQEAACSTAQGLQLQQRRDAVFSQALAALACGFVMRLYAGLEDKGFLRQLHAVGLVAQFESLLSTYSEEIGMLEDMEVGISDLHRVAFRITEAASEEAASLQPTVSGRRDRYTVEVPLPHHAFQALPDELRQGKPLHVLPVLFNVGINEQQTIAERFGDISLQERINQKNFEILEGYYKSLTNTVPSECLPCFQTQTDIKELLDTLGQNVVTKKRKNVEILWLAGMICRRINGIRFTSCKSAKDRTSMSVTLEQCSLLRDEHQLNKDYFVRALDCMRREGCRIENVQKNIKCRKYAFNMLQLMAFPKYYRPPEGTYGKVDS